MSWKPFGDKPAKWLGVAVALCVIAAGTMELVTGVYIIRTASPYNVFACLVGVFMCAFGAMLTFFGSALTYYLALDWRKGE